MPSALFLYIGVCLIIYRYMISPFYPILPISDETKQYLGYPADTPLNFTELTGKYGYTTDEHSVVTEDGYILQLFRIVKAKKCHEKTKKPPVILMHGILQSSDAWIVAGPESGLAYLISDACYDLWLGNARGNSYSRKHVTLDPDKNPEYWQFSLQEMGVYDVPATIDYVLRHTGAEKVNYIGFSQGAATFFVMCSERPDYCRKASLLIALAPGAKIKNNKSFVFRSIMSVVEQFEGLLMKIGTTELFSKGGFTQEFFTFFCQFCDFNGIVCEGIVDVFAGAHHGSVKPELFPALALHNTAGTSVRNLVWCGQAITHDGFKKFDYGKSKNLAIYGTENPAEYNLSAVTVPVLILYGRNDRVVDVQDVKWLEEKLPNVVKSIEVSDPLWNHLDFNFSQFIRGTIFDTINSYLNNYSDL